jgi:uncharacterized protein YbjT (DUF2867 family)
MTSTILLIGATGHIGNSILDELAPDHAAGRLNVRAGGRSETSRAAIAAKGIEPVAFDLDDTTTFDAALEGVDTVFLLRPYTLRQLMHGKLVTDAARRAGATAIVDIGAYGRRETPWPIIGWNFLVEAYIERSGLSFTHLQPNYFMDNILVQRDPSFDTLYNRLQVPVSWIAAADIAAVAAAVLRNPAAHAGKTYPLASEVADTGQIVRMLGEVTGRPHKLGITPREKMIERLLAQGREAEYAAALVDYVDAVSNGEVPEIADTFDTVRQVTGRNATSFIAFLRDHLSG